MKKYKLTGETKLWFDKTLYRIRALIDIKEQGVKKGDLGGWVETEENLSHDGAAWVGGLAVVCDAAQVCDGALVSDSALVYDAARVSGSAQVCGGAQVSGAAVVCETARVSGAALVSGSAVVGGSARVGGAAVVSGLALVSGSARVSSSAQLLTVGPIGSRGNTITFFNSVNKKIMVSCGGFRGDIDQFVAHIRATYGDSKHARACLAAVELAKIQVDSSASDNVVLIP